MYPTLHFIVKGSSGNIYEIEASRNGDNLRMTCTCEAGQHGLYCKHRFALMDGEIKHLLSNNEDDVQTLKQMLAGTDVERRYKIIVELEKQRSKIDAKLRAEKKALAREINS